MLDFLTFVIGVAFAVGGGELFVRGTVTLGRWAGISPALVAMTLASLATSSPELAVSIGAALLGDPAVGFGDVLGSNVVNISLVLGLGLLMRIGGIHIPPGTVRRDYPIALLVPLLTWYFVADGVVAFGEGLFLLAGFFLWYAISFKEALRQRAASTEPKPPERPSRPVLQLLGGLVLLIGAGDFVVAGAKGMALRLGIDEFIVGAMIVAFGTSVPELATVVMSRIRGHDEVGFGTVLGSNILNGLLIAGVTASITPIRVDPREAGAALLFGIICLLAARPGRTGMLPRSRGIVLLAIYCLWLVVLLRLF